MLTNIQTNNLDENSRCDWHQRIQRIHKYKEEHDFDLNLCIFSEWKNVKWYNRTNLNPPL